MFEELISNIESSVTAILTKNSIYSIDNYGWLNENDPDPEYIGHAIWQNDPPGNLDLDSPFSGKPITKRPDDLDEAILVAGEDFSSLMQASRLSIGLMLMHEEQALNKIKNINNEDQFFWLHYLDSILKLNIASDRLRKFFIIGVTRQKLDKKLSRITSLAYKVFEMIEKRNSIAHEIATRWAKVNKTFVRDQRNSFDRQKNEGFKKEDFSEYESLSFDDLKESYKIEEQKHKKELKEFIKEVIDWYQNLIDLSSYVFEIEYSVRRKTCN